MHRVFISHSSKDRNFVEGELIPLLNNHGIDTWYCKENIKSASDWEKSIRDGLKSCDWFMVVMSPHAQESEWVRSEVTWALDKRQGKVIPVLIANCEPSEINLRLTIIQHVDFREKNDTSRVNLLANWGIEYRGGKSERLSIFPAVLGPVNLGFEGPVIDGYPLGWFNSLFYVSRVSPNYEVKVVSRPDERGKFCVTLRRNKAAAREFGSLMQRCLGNYMAGKKVRFEGEVRTNDLEKWAGLWFRADGEGEDLFFYNMSDRPITGTTPWTKYCIEVDVPQGTLWLNYGMLLVGSGEVLGDNFELSYRDQQGKWTPLNQWCYWVPLVIRGLGPHNKTD